MRRKMTLNYNKTPILYLYSNRLKKNLLLYKKKFNYIDKIYYSIKANPYKEILQYIKNFNLKDSSNKFGYEISSLGELKLLERLKIKYEDIIVSNPLKTIEFIKYAYNKNIVYFAFDSIDELKKLKKYAPGAKLYIRLIVDNANSEWPLLGKFGVTEKEAYNLIKFAYKNKQNVIGVTFHIGSQNRSLLSWKKAIQKVLKLFYIMRMDGINLNYINLGGGIPTYYNKPIPSLEVIAKTIKEELLKYKYRDELNIVIEPGRGLVGDIGDIVTTVIAKARRGSSIWISLDVGVFHGLTEALGGIRYKYLLENSKKVTSKSCMYILCGPTCDSMDIIQKNIEFNYNINIGDQLRILNTGAYTTCYQSKFNGFNGPKIVFL